MAFSLVHLVTSDAPISTETQWPVWPETAQAVGSSVGPFPFWCDTVNRTKGAYKFLCLDRDTTVIHKTRLLYSHDRMMQTTYRDHCDLTEFGGVKDVECAHRFLPNGKAYITYGDPVDGYCCQSFGHLPQSNPLPIPHPSFMNTCLKRKGPMPYNGTYYNGMVYNYTDVFAELPTYFWYITAADDERPIEQGEGCVADWARAGECSKTGSVSKLGPQIGDPPFTAFEYADFQPTWFADAEFDVPPVCLGSKLKECYNMECDSPGTGSMRHLDPTFRQFH